ncbi:MAG: hypothetical protein JWP52_2486, partial [Rhizobacter sp.]|nr:hypothetical protein [Rhizobacter sp.]
MKFALSFWVACLGAPLVGCDAPPDVPTPRTSANAMTPDGLPSRLPMGATPRDASTQATADAATASAASAGSAKAASLVLVGTVVSASDVFAFVKELASGQVRQLRKGDAVEGWTVSAIEPDCVTLVDAASPGADVVRVVASSRPPQASLAPPAKPP